MYIGILGGSFNPVHVAHVRLALEMLEADVGFGHSDVAPDRPDRPDYPDRPAHSLCLDRMDLIPCAQPPHKSLRSMLPFALRLAMLRAAVEDIPRLSVNDLEGRRQGPSYTWDTLSAYREAFPQARLLFVVGGEDFGALSHWHRGVELPQFADIAMVSREGSGQRAFRHEVARQWPEARLVHCGNRLHAELPWGARLLYLPLPRLDISASFIRRRWLRGGSVRFLVPDAVLQVLEERRDEVTACWNIEAQAPAPVLDGRESSLE